MLNKFSLRRLGLSTAILLVLSAYVGQAATMASILDPMPGGAHASTIKSLLQRQGFTDTQMAGHYGNANISNAKWEGQYVGLSIDGDNGAIGDLHPGGTAIAISHGTTDDMIRDELARVGYAAIGPIVRKDNMITTAALEDNEQIDLRIDTKTGSLSRCLTIAEAIGFPQKNLSMAELQDQLRPLGYSVVRGLQEVGNFYSMYAFNGSRWWYLTIDARTGEVTKGNMPPRIP